MAQALMNRHSDDAPAEVWPENWDIWRFFMRVQTQWVFAGMSGGRVALRWEGIEPVAQALGWRRRRWRELVEALGVIEFAVLAAEQRQRARKAPSGR